MNSNNFTDSFLEFEKKYKMFDLEFNGVRIWHYIRFNMYYELLYELNITERPSIPETLPISRTNETFEYLVRKYIKCNVFFAQQRDVLIIPHARKYRDGDGYSKCIYTDLLDQKLKQTHYILAWKSVEGVYVKQKSKNVLYFDLESYSNMVRNKTHEKVIIKTDIVEKIVKPIEKYFNIKISIVTQKRWHLYVANYLTKRKMLFRYYNFILQKVKPKLIVMVDAYEYDNMILCEVAHERNIPIIELQHGQFYKEHIAYNFPHKMKLPTFPDYIFTFGHLFEEVRFPIPYENIISVGYPELEKNYRLYNKKKKGNKKTILFVSQCYPEFAKFANSVAEALDSDKYRFIFQLHPFEYSSWKKKIGIYLNNSIIEVVGSYNHTVHESIGKSDWVVGIYSTVLFEALMFDVKIAVVKEGLYSGAEYLYNNGYALLVDSPKQLIDEIEKDTFAMNKNVSFFEKNSLMKMQENIDKILEDND